MRRFSREQFQCCRLGLFLILATSVIVSYAFEKKTANIYTYKSTSGVTSFSDIEPLDVDFSRYRFDCYACEVDSLIDWRKATLYLQPYKNDINKAALKYDIDPAFVRAVIHAESHFNPQAVSKQGAQGLMQLMPATAKELGVRNSLSAQQNIKGGVKHLARLLRKYKGDNKLASAAYNAGEGAVKRHGGIPPYKETQVYVERVGILHQRYGRFSHLNK
ncbi:lytic transglycosylase domain-containing protein [Colwellia psychrerythraea]|uniref:Transglycosylase SLT domain protein n=1 Tax=Colwellia psychrerythraea (strain 34H / ATCC BAA-681) TaxID=167879 RepID=Q47UX0_COLP3|nr:lytic transglycosylase domain-containing protein [Colwellia psychrerythraea]AAZ24046.1 transglycosylase SLT domain protein [Colwellia psychrerythraea 34H]